jgi:transaldolase
MSTSQHQPLVQLFEVGGQSPWLDNLKREYIAHGDFERVLASGIRGLTSNPTIFQKAIEGSDLYDDQFHQCIAQGLTIEETYWELVKSDIVAAADIFAPLYKQSGGLDGYVSVEVSPELAHDTLGTINAAQLLHDQIACPNVMIKIPATVEGIPAIEEVISRGININVTLIFSVDRYADVMKAYIQGLSRLAATAPQRVAHVGSVASFFISRVDSEIDKRLAAIGSDSATQLMGKAAIAQAKVAYQLFERTFSGESWHKLSQAGAHVQRPLWASTSTKNPSYPDTMYVDQLIGPHSVNTLPDQTMDAFIQRGTISTTITQDVQRAHEVWDALSQCDIDPNEIAQQLETEGVASFQKSFRDLLAVLAAKAK